MIANSEFTARPSAIKARIATCDQDAIVNAADDEWR
jgi:hypothetical protein